MTKTTQGKDVALVTGASSGIGAEITRQLAARKIDLIVAARRKDRLEALAQELRAKEGVRVDVVACDLGRPEGARQLFEEVSKVRKDVSILVNNAGFGLQNKVLDHTLEELEAQLQVNVVSLTALTRMFAAEMKAAGRGYILQLSSIGAFQPTPMYAAYSAAKCYVLSFSFAMNRELAGTGVSITSTCPGFTVTEFHDVAGHKKTGLMNLMSMPAARVADISLRAMFARRPKVVPGLLNKLNSFIIELLPRSLATAIAGTLMKK
jgi:uncharacterized protein